MLRSGAVALLGCLLASIAVIVSVRSASASYCFGPYDYAFQYTAGQAGTYHDPACAPTAYFGWIAVNGQVQTPSHFPSLGTNATNDNHSAGWLGMAFNDTPGPLGHSNVQEGWYAGCVGGRGMILCDSASTGLYGYDERYFAQIDDYNIFSAGALSYNSAHIDRIEWDGSHCWVVFKNYNVFQDQMCDSAYPPGQVPRSGEPQATSETVTADQSCVEMPATVYGYSSPNTNNALRIKGAAGYVPWTSTLSHGGTIDWDERNGSPTGVTTNLTVLNADYKIQGSGSC